MQIAPVAQWIKSMYLVLAVFATVGFGNISAAMVDEVVCAAFTMLIGTIVNRITISNMIAIITSSGPSSLRPSWSMRLSRKTPQTM